jgi:hypothetical protein
VLTAKEVEKILKSAVLGAQVAMVLIDLYPAQVPRGLFKLDSCSLRDKSAVAKAVADKFRRNDNF